MPINVTTTGSGELGDLNPGWSVQEFATPASPVERAGGTGMVSFSGATQDESVLLINNASTVTEETLGDVSGVIRSVSESGLTTSLTQDTKMARFDAVRQIPPMQAGSVPGALDLADQLTGTVRLATSEGYFWSLAGHLAAFDSNGEPAPFQIESREYIDFSAGQNEPFPYRVNTYRGAVYGEAFLESGGRMYADGLRGETFFYGRPPNTPPSGYNKIVNRVRFKTITQGDDVVFSYQGGPDYTTNAPTYVGGAVGTVTIDYSAGNLVIDGSRQSPALPNERAGFGGSASLATLNLDEELAVFIDFGFNDIYSPAGISDNIYQINVRVCNTSDYSTVVELDVQYDTGYVDEFYFPWQITGAARSLQTRQDEDRSNYTPADWENAPAFSFIGSVTFGPPVIGFDGNVWDWLQDACVVYRWEIGLDVDAVQARALGGRILDITNYSPSPVLTPTATLTGRQVDINYTQATSVDNKIVYEAREDDNRILSVGAGQTTVTTINLDAYLLSVVSPTRTTTFIPGAGTYYVVDSIGLPIVEDQWEDYGGGVAVTLDPEVVGGVVVTLTGPDREIPSTTAPYSLAVSDGENQYAALSFFGSGVLADPQLLELLTGADPEKTPTKVATTITNPFIATRQQAFDTGIWATVDASGPKVGLTLSVPTRALAGFGLTPGSLIAWRESTYRVMDASVGNLVTSLNCVRHATVSDFDTVWAGSTVAAHDAVWAGYLAEDQKILTYRA